MDFSPYSKRQVCVSIVGEDARFKRIERIDITTPFSSETIVTHKRLHIKFV